MKRREAREKILQLLFQIDINKEDQPMSAIRLMFDEDTVSSEDFSFIENRVSGTFQHLQEIDQNIMNYLKGWTITRLANVDRAVLRLATYELMYINDTSVNVILNEAVELAKNFGTNDSPKFINGVLGSLAKDLRVAKENKTE